MLHLPPDWIKKFMGLVQASRAQNLPLGVTTQGPFVILPLRCTSHIHGLFELTDTVDIRIRVRVDDTQAATLGPAVGSRSASTFSNTRPGAFTNAAAASSFNFSGTSKSRLSKDRWALRVDKYFLLLFPRCFGAEMNRLDDAPPRILRGAMDNHPGALLLLLTVAWLKAAISVQPPPFFQYI